MSERAKSSAVKIPIITSDYLIGLYNMIEQLTEKVDQISTAINDNTAPVIQLPSAPDEVEISLLFLANALGISKTTVERRIVEKKIPKPRINTKNHYRYWYKYELPKNLHDRIDIHYFDSNKNFKKEKTLKRNR